jgi:hypothetical protein
VSVTLVSIRRMGGIVIARKWPRIFSVVTALVLMVGAGVLAAPGLMDGRRVEGAPTANSADVAAVRAEREAAEEQARIAAEVLTNMREHFSDPERSRLGIEVLDIALVRVAEYQYEGLVKMTAFGGSPSNVKVDVHADGRTVMWQLDRDDVRRLFF